MKLDECPDSVDVFVDANILYYHFVDLPPLSEQCTAFLDRATAGSLSAYTSVAVLADTTHKVMLADAVAAYHLPRPGLVRYLREHPGFLGGLCGHLRVVPEVESLGIAIEPLRVEDVRAAAEISRTEGLLTGDALILAIMRRIGVSLLATNDSDFERVGEIACYLPR